jgi:Nucleotidyl transferase
MPKQFVPLVGEGSTFHQVLARISDAELFARPIVITNTDFRFVVAEQLCERGVVADIVLEPMRRDSGPAVAVSAVLAAERDRDALVLVLAADHVIRKHCGIPRGLPARRRHRRRGTDRHLRYRAHLSSDELRLHPPRREAQWRVRSHGRGVCREAGCHGRCELRSRTVSVEQRQLLVSRRDHARRDRALRARDGGRRQGGDVQISLGHSDFAVATR